MVKDPDLSLVKKARAGDFTAFEQLVTRHENRLYGLALRILRSPEDAEEAVQEAFMKALEKLDQFRGEAKFSSWMIRITTNGALKILQKNRKMPTDSMDSPADENSGQQGLPRPEYIAKWRDTPEKFAMEQEYEGIIRQALEQLDEKYRLVFLLRDVEELSTEETAEALGISVANVKVRLLRARLMLREKLTRVFGDDTRVFEPHAHEG
jgi:RNA polymerase sigma-70 factor, ECF subfamily